MLAYAGKGKVAIVRVDLNRLVHEMTELLSVSLSKKALIRYDLAPGAARRSWPTPPRCSRWS